MSQELTEADAGSNSVISASETKPLTERLFAIDALRGVIMITMALDHANTFISHGKLGLEFWGGRFPQYSDTLQFLTRFVTHLSAPGFFFLMGASMTLFAASRRKRDWTQFEIIRHYFIRGLLLIALQVFIENPAWNLGASRTGPLFFGVLYGLGGAMIVGAFFLSLPSNFLLGLSVLLTLGAHFLVRDPAGVTTEAPLLMGMAFVPGFTAGIFVLYPVLPWLAMAMFGMVFGRWLLTDEEQTYRRAALIGALFLILFVVVRTTGTFGNIRAASGPGWINFLNVVKYPPSLVFILLTLGVDLLLLAGFARIGSGLRTIFRPVVVFGQNALFFYLLHLYLFALIGLTFGRQGTTIPGMYPYWLLGLLLLVPLCWFYGDFKQRQAPESLWRFL